MKKTRAKPARARKTRAKKTKAKRTRTGIPGVATSGSAFPENAVADSRLKIAPVPTPATSKTKKTAWAWTIATFFGAGYWRRGPGTAGSVAAAAIWLLVGYSGGWVLSIRTLTAITAAAALALLIVAIPASTLVARESGRKDPQFVVADEAVGQWITLLGAPAQLRYALLGLVLFRLFDIWKPFPIRKIEHLPEGWGIMLDDVGAGIYAFIVVQIVRLWLR